MKYKNIIKRSFLMALVATAATACQEDVNIGNIQAPDVTGSEDALLYVSDANGSTGLSKMEFRSTGSLELYVNATAPGKANENVTLSYDPTVLEQYNKANNSDFVAVPQSMVALSNGGSVTLAAGETQSAPVTLTLTSDGSLEAETTYAVPLRISSTGNLATMSQSRIVFVKDLTALPDCFKTWTDENGVVHDGVKIFSCMEVNDTNPLNNLRYTLKNSGKYLIDALIIFSGNINYNAETGRVYFFANNNVQHLLDNREKYLKPLQDRGMKIIMGILGNHDCAGVGNLAPETARLFAQELKGICDAYNLDGVFWDDEYSNYPLSNIPPGFVKSSQQASSRLLYEVWKAQPQRLNIAYVYHLTRALYEVDGTPAGVYCQYALHDYGAGWDVSGNYPGMPRSNMGLYSQEFNLGRYASESSLRSMRNDGFGAHMVFALDPTRRNRASQETALGRCARAFYDDELVIDETLYVKDW